MRCVCHPQNILTFLANTLGLSRMHDGRSQQSQVRVMMFLIVPGKERVRPRARIDQTTETLGIIRSILERFELRFGIRIVVRDMRPRVGLDHIY